MERGQQSAEHERRDHQPGVDLQVECRVAAELNQEYDDHDHGQGDQGRDHSTDENGSPGNRLGQI